MEKYIGGRPSKYSPALADEICRRLAEGESFARICRDEDMPDFSTIWRWERAHPEFAEQTQMALQHGTHFIAHDCIRIADDTEMDVPNRKLMVDTRLRLIGKWNRKAYGDKLAVEQTRALQDASDEELKAALQRKFRELSASGFDPRELLSGLE